MPAKGYPRKRRSKSGWWFDIFEEMQRMDRMMDELSRKGMTLPGIDEGPQPFVYGFSISVDSDGEPVVREFGNVAHGSGGPRMKEEREPLVDVIESGRNVVVVSELPGVEKDDIQLEATERVLKVSVESSKRRFFKEMELPSPVDPRTAQASYKNGVLEVRFFKSGQKQPARPIKLE